MHSPGRFVAKWLGYLDKFLFFPRQLRRKLAAGFDLVHICDHSNAMYCAHVGERPVIVTCHDLLAVRGALGEETGCPASATGKYLQRWIVSGLRQARRGGLRLIRHPARRGARGRASAMADRNFCSFVTASIIRIENSRSIARRLCFRASAGFDPDRPFALHVGSNLRMKNREGVLRIFALTKNDWNGQMVFAGQKLTPELRSLGQSNLVCWSASSKSREPDNELLEALYSTALVLLYPSRFEGFGWPIIEAQACGCPVICSDREPMSEVGGDAALIANVDDEPAMARVLVRLTDPAERARWSEKSLRNAERFRAEEMIARYIELYRSLGARV